jgi:hypothetical protein
LSTDIIIREIGNLNGAREFWRRSVGGGGDQGLHAAEGCEGGDDGGGGGGGGGGDDDDGYSNIVTCHKGGIGLHKRTALPHLQHMRLNCATAATAATAASKTTSASAKLAVASSSSAAAAGDVTYQRKRLIYP